MDEKIQKRILNYENFKNGYSLYMSRYYDYFEEPEHTAGEVIIDEFIAETMRTDLKIKTPAEKLPFD